MEKTVNKSKQLNQTLNIPLDFILPLVTWLQPNLGSGALTQTNDRFKLLYSKKLEETRKSWRANSPKWTFFKKVTCHSILILKQKPKQPFQNKLSPITFYGNLSHYDAYLPLNSQFLLKLPLYNVCFPTQMSPSKPTENNAKIVGSHANHLLKFNIPGEVVLQLVSEEMF